MQWCDNLNGSPRFGVGARKVDVGTNATPEITGVDVPQATDVVDEEAMSFARCGNRRHGIAVSDEPAVRQQLSSRALRSADHVQDLTEAPAANVRALGD